MWAGGRGVCVCVWGGGGGIDTYGRSLGCAGLGTVRGRTALALAAAGMSRRKIQTRCHSLSESRCGGPRGEPHLFRCRSGQVNSIPVQMSHGRMATMSARGKSTACDLRMRMRVGVCEGADLPSNLRVGRPLAPLHRTQKANNRTEHH